MKYNFITVDTLFAKFARELKDTTINEGDIIEWIGEALGFMKSPKQNEEAIAIIEVRDYTAILPTPIRYLLQVAKIDIENETCNKDFKDCESLEDLYNKLLEQEENPTEEVNYCKKDFYEGNSFIMPGTYSKKYSYIDYLTTSYSKHKKLLQPMRLANNKFFNTLVCKENNRELQEYYTSCSLQYSIIGESNLHALRTSFKQGYIIVAYVRSPVDDETGYPLIPDEINHIQAINYYVRWKIAESLAWVGREGYDRIALASEDRWLKYIRQANNVSKMPMGLDDYEDLRSQSLYLLPRTNVFNNYFGSLNKNENLRF